MKIDKETLELLKHGSVEQRLELLNKICTEPEKALEHQKVLIEFLNDDWDNYLRGSAFGPTDINPETDLEIAIKARDFLCTMGDAVVPALIDELKGYISERKHYYAVQILGHLRAKKAIPIFKKMILRNDFLKIGVNFDQWDILNISGAAFNAFLNTDKAECKKFIESVIDDSYFNKFPEHKVFKIFHSSYREMWKNSFLKQLNETE